MTKPNYTPGPWLVVGGPHEKFPSIKTVGIQPKNSSFYLEVGEDNPVNNANAKLIAAAPELYEALEYLVDLLEQLPLMEYPCEHWEGQDECVCCTVGNAKVVLRKVGKQWD